MDHLFSLFYAKIALIASYVSDWKELTVFHWNNLAKPCIKKQQQQNKLVLSLWSVFSPHLIKNSGKCISPDLPENNDAPFMFAGLRPDVFSHNLFLQGLLDRIVLLSSLASSSGHVPWEKIPQSKAIHFQRQRFTSVVSYNTPPVTLSPLTLIQNLRAHLKSRWPLPRFLDNSQPLLPALQARERGERTEWTWGGRDSNAALITNHVVPSFCEVRFRIHHLPLWAILQCFSFSLCISLLMAK